MMLKIDGEGEGVLIYYENRLLKRFEHPKLEGFLGMVSRDVNLGDKEQVNIVSGYVKLDCFFKPNLVKTVSHGNLGN